MTNQPKVQLPRTFLDGMLDALYWVVLALLWLYVIMHYGELPDKIPIHFDWKGQPDNTGAKYTLWMLPVMATIIGMVFSVLEKYPHVFNYPVTITESNAQTQYVLAVRMLKVLRIAVTLLFTVVVYTVFEYVRTGWTFDSIQFNFGVACLVFVPIGLYLFFARKVSR